MKPRFFNPRPSSPFPKSDCLLPKRYFPNPETPVHDLTLTVLRQVLIYEGVVTGVLNFDHSSSLTLNPTS